MAFLEKVGKMLQLPVIAAHHFTVNNSVHLTAPVRKLLKIQKMKTYK